MKNLIINPVLACENKKEYEFACVFLREEGLEFEVFDEEDYLIEIYDSCNPREWADLIRQITEIVKTL